MFSDHKEVTLDKFWSDAAALCLDCVDGYSLHLSKRRTITTKSGFY